MYIKRDIDDYLLRWKASENRKPLLLRGARQIGKSSSVRHFAESFDNYIEVNFEKRPELTSIFSEVSDVRELAARLAKIEGVALTPGSTLLFIDEIQACTEAIRSLWRFKEDFPGLHVVAAGSLLEFTLKDLTSFGVGRVQSMFMYPMSFDEFLVACGRDSWIEAKREASPTRPLFDALHHQLVQAFRSFIMVGGMPSAVVAWVQSGDYQAASDELASIQQSYYDDFSKYSRRVNTQLLRDTLRSVISQVGGKFVYNKVAGGYRNEDVKMALSMLCDSGLIMPVRHTAANGLPLGAEVNNKFTKYIYLDSGLMLSVLQLDFGGVKEINELILAGAADDLVNKGKLTEMIVGWELVKYHSRLTRTDLYYWENLSRGASAEIDYVVAREMKVLPIEVKAGTSGKMKSMWNFLEQKHLTWGIRTSLENFARLTPTNSTNPDTRIDLVPLYALSGI
jgi:hypothetical protein